MPDFISLADVCICCSQDKDLALPAHSQVLARHSAVVGALVASLHEAGNPPSCSKPLDISQMFEEAEAEEIVLLLQCFYGWPCGEVFSSCGPRQQQALLRLAHKLDASSVVVSLEQYLHEDTNDSVTRDTLGWLEVAELLQLDDLRCTVLQLLIWQLAQRPATVVGVLRVGGYCAWVWARDGPRTGCCVRPGCRPSLPAPPPASCHGEGLQGRRHGLNERPASLRVPGKGPWRPLPWTRGTGGSPCCATLSLLLPWT